MALQSVDISGRAGSSGRPNRLKGKVTLDLGSCATVAVTLLSAAIPDVKPGDQVTLTPSAADISVGVMVGTGYCLVAGTAKFPVVNPTAGNLDPASQVYDYCIQRSAT